MRSSPSFAVLVVAAGVALTACGGSQHRKATGASHDAALTAARCMRTHGVPNFPDPGARGGMTVVFSPGSSTPTVDGIHFSGPAFTSAVRVCKPFGGPQPGAPTVSAQQRRALLGFARCMRHHGLPRWADPTFPPGGGIMGGGLPGRSNNPIVRHATEVCNAVMSSSRSGG